MRTKLIVFLICINVLSFGIVGTFGWLEHF